MEGRPLSKVVKSRPRWPGLLVAVFHACLSLASPPTHVLAYGLPWTSTRTRATLPLTMANNGVPGPEQPTNRFR
jgi:hypothetical protein